MIAPSDCPDNAPGCLDKPMIAIGPDATRPKDKKAEAIYVFYSASLLPQPFETLTHFNPVYYMIGIVRYGFLGYSETDVGLSLAVLVVVVGALAALNYRLFARGSRLRA